METPTPDCLDDWIDQRKLAALRLSSQGGDLSEVRAVVQEDELSRPFSCALARVTSNYSRW